MIAFFKFIIKCLWQGSYYVFSSGPSGEKTQAPFDILGIIGFGVFSVSFLLLLWFVVKFDSFKLQIICSLFLSLIAVLAYFLIAYYFVM